jgi:hypothetical protein
MERVGRFERQFLEGLRDLLRRILPARAPASSVTVKDRLVRIGHASDRRTFIIANLVRCATASRRNSGGYGLWSSIPWHGGPPPRPIGLCRPSAQVSTKAGASHVLVSTPGKGFSADSLTADEALHAPWYAESCESVEWRA